MPEGDSLHSASGLPELDIVSVRTNKSAIQTLVTFRNSQGEVARGTLLKIDRSTMVFEVYNPYSIVQLSEVLQELAIRRGERKIYEGRAVVNNLVNTGLMLIVSVTLVDPWKDLAGILESPGEIRQEAERFVADWGTSNILRTGYQLIVGEIQSFFSDLSRWLEQVDVGTSDTALDNEQGLNDEYFQELLEPVAEQTNKLFLRFEEEAEAVTNEEIFQHKAYIQRCLHPLIMRAPFPYRAFFKPLGYAGDYETVNMMLRDPRTGPTTYAEVINSLYLLTGPAQAHRNRIIVLTDLLNREAVRAKEKGNQFQVLNVGCGPAAELQKFIEQADTVDCRFTLVDFNRETLNYTKEKIEQLQGGGSKDVQVDYQQLSVHALLKGASKNNQQQQMDHYDLIYCAGLFDYFSDKVCSRLLKLFYQWLKPDGGTILVTNVHPRNSSSYMMEHLLEWYLVYRDEPDMVRLFPGVGKQRTFVDETGINVFLEIDSARNDA